MHNYSIDQYGMHTDVISPLYTFIIMLFPDVCDSVGIRGHVSVLSKVDAVFYKDGV